MPSFPDGEASRSTVAIATRPRTRSGGRTFLLSAALFLLLIMLLVAMNLAVLAPQYGLADRVLGRPHYYVALGDSITFGFQPTLNFTHGYADDVFAGLRKANVTHLVNFACLGESTGSMLDGSCPYRNILKQAYSGTQLNTAVAFLDEHRGQINPVTLSIGGNDVLPSIVSCRSFPDPQRALEVMDEHLTTPNTGILPRLTAALEVAPGERGGDLVLLTYYNPYAASCPDSVTFIHQLNDHLARDAAQFRIPIVDVYSAFGGDANMASNVCQLTWYCEARYNHDIHPTTAGYQRIAAAVAGVLGYPTIDPAIDPSAEAPDGLVPRARDTAAPGHGCTCAVESAEAHKENASWT